MKEYRVIACASWKNCKFQVCVFGCHLELVSQMVLKIGSKAGKGVRGSFIIY